MVGGISSSACHRRDNLVSHSPMDKCFLAIDLAHMAIYYQVGYIYMDEIEWMETPDIDSLDSDSG